MRASELLKEGLTTSKAIIKCNLGVFVTIDVNKKMRVNNLLYIYTHFQCFTYKTTMSGVFFARYYCYVL